MSEYIEIRGAVRHDRHGGAAPACARGGARSGRHRGRGPRGRRRSGCGPGRRDDRLPGDHAGLLRSDTLTGRHLSSPLPQRIKLASELHRKGNVYVLDEPTTGLHKGGRVIFEGPPRQLMEAPGSLTGEHLACTRS